MEAIRFYAVWVMLMRGAILLALQPAFPVEKYQENGGNGRHQQQTERVAQGPTQLRHIPRTDLRLEIHAVDASNETQGHENSGDNRQDFHHFVEVMTLR